MRLFAKLTILVLASLLHVAAPAEPVRPDHPLVGAWRIEIPGLGCDEVYSIRANGTTLVTSAAEVAESEFVLADQPSTNGFYKWTDRITRDNGKHDCAGQVTEVGRESTNYILMHPSGNAFVMCAAEDNKSCMGLFLRVTDGGI
jgi:hypothetical protein